MMEKLRQHDISMNQGPWPCVFFLLAIQNLNTKSHQISLLQIVVSGAALQLPRSQLCAGCKGHQGWVLKQRNIEVP